MIGEKTYQQLRAMGIAQVRTLQEMPLEMMEQLLGKTGRMLWQRANGIDDTPVMPYHERKSISIERTFERDTTDVNKLRSILIAMAENLAYQLRHGQKLASSITVRIRYSDFQTVSKQIQIPHTAADKIVIDHTLRLFNALYKRRVMVRLIGVRFSGLAQGSFQISLFDDTTKELELLKAMDSIRNQFGQNAVKRAVAMGSNNISRPNPFNGLPPVIPAHRRS